MSVPTYATDVQLTAWLAGGDYAGEADNPRRRLRASEVIADYVFGQYVVDSETDLPTDDDPLVEAALVAAFADATCAQVEQWLEVGEENDIAGYPDGTAMALGAGAVTHLPSRLAPRAGRILRRVGLTPTEPSDDSTLLTVELV